MSYQSKKTKKSKLNKLKFFIGLILARFFNKIKKIRKEEKPMRVFGTKKVMEFLRERRRQLGKGIRINQWVDEYLQECFLNGQKVVIITPWSFSTALKGRFETQGNMFIPTSKERKLFEEKIPEVMKIFKENGFRLDWWILLARSCLDSRLIGPKLEDEYQEMITNLAKPLFKKGLIIANLEDDVLGRCIIPDKEMLENLEKYVQPTTLKLELEKWQEWAEVTGFEAPKEQIDKETRYQTAAMIKEGEILMDPEFPLGTKYLLFLLESPENFFFLTILAPDINKRMVTVLPYFPWRMTAKG